MKVKRQRCKYLLTDFVLSSVVWILFNVLRYYEFANKIGYETIRSYLLDAKVLLVQCVVPFFWLMLFFLSGYYNHPYGKSRFNEFFITLISVSIGVVVIFFTVVLNDFPQSFEIYYHFLFVLFVVQFVLIYWGRLYWTNKTLSLRRKGLLKTRVLLVGVGEETEKVRLKLENLSCEVVEVVDFPNQQIKSSATDFDEIVVVPLNGEEMVDLKAIYALYKYNCPIKVRMKKSQILSKVTVNTIHDLPLVDVTGNKFTDFEQNIKWLFDKVISLLSLILFSPLFVFLAWRIKRDSSGTVFFKQERIGYRGKPFMIYKFRTMVTDAEKEGPQLSHVKDCRITPFGTFLRKYRLDELPQFWNVLKGDMSLVGPRPERQYYIDSIVKRAPYYYLLHNVRPGITSLGMVKYGYAENVDRMLERLEYDMIYYENMSLKLDLMILIYTIKTVVTGKGM